MKERTNDRTNDRKKGWICRAMVRSALEKYGDDLVIAVAGAIAKTGKKGAVPVIYDGSSGTTTNPGIRFRDQVKCFTSLDGKAVLAECVVEGGPRYSVQSKSISPVPTGSAAS